MKKAILLTICLLWVPVFFSAGCAEKGTTRLEPIDFSALEADLQRGVSTKAAVRRLLGEPNGAGGLQMPEQYGFRSAWYYEKIDVAAPGGTIDIQQEILLVFFKGDLFDGYFWFSDSSR